MKYIAKPNTWFDAGTEVRPVCEFWYGYDDAEMTIPSMAAIFCGYRNGQLDEEVCSLNEFNIIEDGVK